MPAVPGRVFIVVPAYNEGQRLLRVLDDLARTPHAVVVVDDGSRDDTFEVARGRGVYALRHTINRGQGAALQTGISFALREGADFIVTFDADGQHLASELDQLLAPVAAGQCDVALGNVSEAAPRTPAMRKVCASGAALRSSRPASASATAYNGYRVLSRGAASAIYLKQDRWRTPRRSTTRSSARAALPRSAGDHPPAETLAKGAAAVELPGVLFQYSSERSRKNAFRSPSRRSSRCRALVAVRVSSAHHLASLVFAVAWLQPSCS
jgi:hypothetical protein